ncbi:MAG: CopG family transcriptional regulator [Thermoanaerobaculia bacterium]
MAGYEACDVKTSKRYTGEMSSSKRSTIYLDPAIHRAVRLKAAAMDVSISEVVNSAVRRSLSEDAEDLEAFDKRRREPALDFEDVVRDMRRSGKL